MRRIAAGRTGLTIVFVWGFAEALMWPLIPDSALMALAFAVGSGVAAVAGNGRRVCGGRCVRSVAGARGFCVATASGDRPDERCRIWLDA